MNDFETTDFASAANGTYRRPPKLTKWIPKKWRPEYDKMVILTVSGLSNKQIGDALGFTKEHVSSVLNTPKAEEMIEQYQVKMRERAHADIPGQLHKIAEKTVERIYMAVHDDTLFEKSPFAVIDRGMDVIKGLGHLKAGNPQEALGHVNVQGNAVFSIGGEFADKLLSGLDKANEVRQIHGSQKKLTKADGDT